MCGNIVIEIIFTICEGGNNMKKPLDLIMKEVFIEYLHSIDIFITMYDVMLSEMIETVRKNNPSAPHIAVGSLTYEAVKRFEKQ